MARRIQGEARTTKRRGLDSFSGFQGRSIIDMLEDECDAALSAPGGDQAGTSARGRAVGLAQGIALMRMPLATPEARARFVKRRVTLGRDA